MNINEMTTFLEEKSQELFGIDFEIPVEFKESQYFKTQMFLKYNIFAPFTVIFAGFFRDENQKAKVIYFNQEAAEFMTDEEIKLILLHELTHYALFVQGLDHKDDSPTFETEVVRAGSFGHRSEEIQALSDRIYQAMELQAVNSF